MFILGLDTSRLPIRLSLRKDGAFVYECTYQDLKLEQLPDKVAQIFELLEISNTDLIAIGAITGPGNYTGLRSGLAMAKTMAQVLNLPLYGFNTLDILLYGTRHLKQEVSPLVNVRQRQIYTGLGEWQDTAQYRISPHTIALADWLKTLEQEVPQTLLCGDPFEWPQGLDWPFVPIDNTADLVAQLTWEAYQKNPVSDLYAVEPFYIRPAVVAPKQPKKETLS